MKIRTFSLFPDMFASLDHSLLGKAQDKGLVHMRHINFRDYATDKHKHVDATPYGGGAGMLLKPEPLVAALQDHVDYANPQERVLLMTPQGAPFDQKAAQRLSQYEALHFVCGHYEGFDERIRYYVHEEWSLGDFVLTGGELPAMVMIDAILRLKPGVIKEQVSYEEDSFYQGLLEYPQYTRPPVFQGLEVPEVLMSGHHAKIQAWQRKEALRRTLIRRPDLLDHVDLSQDDLAFLEEIKTEEGL